jgi:predicted permease
MLRDLRYALRQLRASPATTAVIVLSLALGIGANTAIFSLVNAVLLTTLPVKDPGALVSISWGGNEWPRPLNQSSNGAPQGSRYKLGSYSMGFPFFEQVAADRSTFTAVFGFAPLGGGRQNTTISVDGIASRVDGEMVAGDYFTGLGTTPLMGRLLTRADDKADGGAAVVSYALWNRRLGRDPGIVGKRILVNGLSFEIVGVTRPAFFGPEPGRSPDIWVPAVDSPALTPFGFRPPDAPSLMATRTYWWLAMMGRLAPGIDRARVQASVGAQFQQFVTDALAIPAGSRLMPSLVVLPADRGIDALTQDFTRPLVVLMAIVGVVLLIACANVATLLVARATARRREIAIRLSIGASRGRLVRQLLTESLTLAVLGGAIGVLTASWSTRGLLALLPEDRRIDVATGLDGSVLVFTAVVTLATGVLFGLLPALRATRADVAADIKPSSGLRPAGGSRVDLGGGFVIAQVALSLVLVFGAGLFIRTLRELRSEKLGVDTKNVLVVGLDATQNGYAGERLAALYQALLERLPSIPGVANVTATRLPLFAGWVSNGPVTFQGLEPKPGGSVAHYNGVGPSFAETMGLKLRAGRGIDAADVRAGKRVALINEMAAEYFFGAADPVGRRFSFGGRLDLERQYEIIGVIQNAKYNNVRGPFPRTLYVPYTAMPAMLGGLSVQIRTLADPTAILPSVRRVVQELEPGLALANVRTESDQVAEALWQERLLAQLVTAFGALALALACIGVYGTMSYAVSRRTKEIGVRIAIGARTGQVMWQELMRAMRLALIGVAIGLPLALVCSRLVSSQLFGVNATDPTTMGGAMFVLMAVTAAAGFLPARRAAAVDPITALRAE